MERSQVPRKRASSSSQLRKYLMLRLRNSADRFIGQEVFSFIIENNKTIEIFFSENILYMVEEKRPKHTNLLL